MAKLSRLRQNIEAETSGVWIAYAEGIELCLCRLGNANYRAMLRRLTRPHLPVIKADTDEGRERVADAMKRAVAHHVLTGWRNMEDDDGQPIAYSPEKAYELFSDPELADFYDDVLRLAGDRDLYRQEDLEADAGN